MKRALSIVGLLVVLSAAARAEAPEPSDPPVPASASAATRDAREVLGKRAAAGGERRFLHLGLEAAPAAGAPASADAARRPDAAEATSATPAERALDPEAAPR